MPQTTMTSREANQDFSRAKRASKNGPVIITERGVPAQVLLGYEDYRKLLGKQPNLLDLLAMPESDHIELEIPARTLDPLREIDLS